MLRNILNRTALIPRLTYNTYSFSSAKRLTEAAMVNAPESLVYEMRNKKKQIALRKHRRKQGKKVSLRW